MRVISDPQPCGSPRGGNRLQLFRVLRRWLVLDEPTAALPDPNWLFRQLARVTAAGASVIYISHKLNEINTICDTGTVLRNGQAVASFTRGELSEDDLVELMIGRSFSHAFPAKPDEDRIGDVVLDVRELKAGVKLAGGVAPGAHRRDRRCGRSRRPRPTRALLRLGRGNCALTGARCPSRPSRARLISRLSPKSARAKRCSCRCAPTST